jgi:hypothetical protein
MLKNKDAWATAIRSGAGFGFVMIGAYYMWLGFTPSLTIGQGSLLLLQASVAGFLSSIPIGAAVYIVVLLVFNSGSMPLRGTAAVLGIAVERPVEVILPNDTCPLVKKALINQNLLRCEGADAGRLKGVHLLNTLGERWVAREEGHRENIVFEGKGAVVRTLAGP